MNCIILKHDVSFQKDVSELYLSAFPENERPPLHWFLRCLYSCVQNEVFSYYEDGFIGFAEITIHQDIVYICFLAVTEENRNKGYGSKIISDIKDKYPGYTLLVCFEEVDEKYPDYDNRKRRQNFYIKNGFKENNLKTREGDVIFQSAYCGKRKVTFAEYKILFDQCYGKEASDTYLREVK